MNANLILDAISNLDSILLEEHFKTKEALQRKKEYKTKLILHRWVPISACLVLITALISNIFIHHKSQQPPQIPDNDNIIWANDLYIGGIDLDENINYIETELNNTTLLYDKKVSLGLYNEFSNSTNNEYYAILVTNQNGNFLATDEDVKIFMQQGIYAEITNEKLYIFITAEQFEKLSLSSEQQSTYVFILADHWSYNN